ncbi:formyltetrahydrofolate deformylase [Sphingomonas sp. M6A6_1c]
MSGRNATDAERTIVRLSCRNAPGIVACVAKALSDAGYDIRDSQQFEDIVADRFFMRVVFHGDHAIADDEVTSVLAGCVDRYRMEVATVTEGRPARVLLLTSRTDHCLLDLLHRWRDGELQMDPVAIVSDHPHRLCRDGRLHGLAFHHLPATPSDGSDGRDERILQIVEETGAELIVLARYMRILSSGTATQLAGRCINIHHSFLPGFKGARPYHQAHDRGVKMIGASAHYVTPELDEGPIIAQDVVAVTHADGPDELVRKGRDVERRVLAQAVRLHIEGRVLINGRRTIVFRS